ncbi:MAG: hypothetical protein Q7T70_02760 [Polaromonas sp.]|nr:hypothetical protein [Polaromonas sp.]
MGLGPDVITLSLRYNAGRAAGCAVIDACLFGLFVLALALRRAWWWL